MAESVSPLPSLHVDGKRMESRGVTRSATFGLADIPPGALVEVAETDFGQVRQEAERAATRAIVLRIFAPLFFSRRCTCST